jgi:hypothetical protein
MNSYRYGGAKGKERQKNNTRDSFYTQHLHYIPKEKGRTSHLKGNKQAMDI